jgi:hypothetical protein
MGIIVNLSVIIGEITGHVHKRGYKKCLDGDIDNLKSFDGYTEN